MIHKLRQSKRLNNRTFRSLLGPTIQHLDLGAVYLTETTLRLVGQRCPDLRVLNLRECGYIITDHVTETLLKVCLDGTLYYIPKVFNYVHSNPIYFTPEG